MDKYPISYLDEETNLGTVILYMSLGMQCSCCLCKNRESAEPFFSELEPNIQTFPRVCDRNESTCSTRWSVMCTGASLIACFIVGVVFRSRKKKRKLQQNSVICHDGQRL